MSLILRTGLESEPSKNSWPNNPDEFLAQLYTYFCYVHEHLAVSSNIMAISWNNGKSVTRVKHRISKFAKERCKIGIMNDYDSLCFGEALTFISLWQKGERQF